MVGIVLASFRKQFQSPAAEKFFSEKGGYPAGKPGKPALVGSETGQRQTDTGEFILFDDF